MASLKPPHFQGQGLLYCTRSHTSFCCIYNIKGKRDRCPQIKAQRQVFSWCGNLLFLRPPSATSPPPPPPAAFGHLHPQVP